MEKEYTYNIDEYEIYINQFENKMIITKTEDDGRIRRLYEGQTEATKYIDLLIQQCKKRQKIIDKTTEYINNKFVAQGGFTSYEWNDLLAELLEILGGQNEL